MKTLNQDQSYKRRKIQLQRGTMGPPSSLFLWITFFSASSSVFSSSFFLKWPVFNSERVMIWYGAFSSSSSPRQIYSLGMDRSRVR
ncbi:Hypothetical predicted protein [Olea europaea subsp. europaea]|uniref:Uncharacterized protein n=1 Tax=Olea europaea subsp. europaea TaxID=158383 RepID=A0A8S0RL85_OLEEU|nr:Hypothetical predicted protein [Olea europaea subsp. europaea]